VGPALLFVPLVVGVPPWAQPAMASTAPTSDAIRTRTHQRVGFGGISMVPSPIWTLLRCINSIGEDPDSAGATESSARPSSVTRL